MKTLIIFDNTGSIYFQASGDIREPQGGLNYLWVELKENQYVDAIDVSGDAPTAIIKEHEQPIDDVAELKAQVEDLNNVVLQLILNQGSEVIV